MELVRYREYRIYIVQQGSLLNNQGNMDAALLIKLNGVVFW